MWLKSQWSRAKWHILSTVSCNSQTQQVINLEAHILDKDWIPKKEDTCTFCCQKVKAIVTSSVHTSLLYPPQTKFGGGYIWITRSVCLSVRLSVQSKLNLVHNFLTKGDKALIFHMCISCGKTFLLEPIFFISWPWRWLLTYFWKNLTFTITFEPKVMGR